MSIDKNRNLTVQKLKLPETLRKSVRVLSQRQMISRHIRSSILIMRMEISVRYPIRRMAAGDRRRTAFQGTDNRESPQKLYL